MTSSLATPLLSIIIPTYNRPQFIRRAVESALRSEPNGDVEIIIVPNGGDDTWKKSLADFLHNPKILVSPIEKGHANAARNHGLKLAKGKYIRFLDDDDFLLEGSIAQLEYMIANNLDICSGYICHYTEDYGILGRVKIPAEKTDFVQACLAVSGLTLVHANLYLKSCLNNIYWDESVPWLQDNIWVLTLAAEREWKWSYFYQDVGVWVHHNNIRVSLSGSIKPSPWVVEKLVKLLNELHRQNRINVDRGTKIILRLREYAHINFPNSPIYCYRLILNLPNLSSKVGLDYKALKNKGIWIEWIMLPYRFLKNKLRTFKPILSKVVLRKL